MLEKFEHMHQHMRLLSDLGRQIQKLVMDTGDLGSATVCVSALGFEAET